MVFNLRHFQQYFSQCDFY